MTYLLDNSIRNVLTGPYAGMAIGSGLARQYPREIAPFCTLAEPTAAAPARISPGRWTSEQRNSSEPYMSRYSYGPAAA